MWDELKTDWGDNDEPTKLDFQRIEQEILKIKEGL
jgi:hypothetical protein